VPQFNPEFAHHVLLPIAEAAYLPRLQFDSLPPGYELVGPIRVDQNAAGAQIVAAAPSATLAPHLALVQRMRRDGDGFGWVAQNTDKHILVVSFRGTVSLADWLHDFDCLPAPYEPVANYGTVHKGFQAVYQVVRESMLDEIQRADQKFTRLIVTGHSLGAALCELAAPDLLHNAGLAVVPEVQHFAGPRAGHHDFASRFDAEISACFRVVNAWDIVPQLPPPLALFEHVGAAVRVNGGFTLDELTAHSLDKSYAPGLAKLVPQAGVPLKTASMAAMSAVPEMLIGREP
jgi:triacylglycerol lipase